MTTLLRSNLLRDGFAIERGVFDADEVARMREELRASLAAASENDQVWTEDGPDGQIRGGVGDLLSFPALSHVLLDPRVLKIAGAALSVDRPVYFGDSSFRLASSGRRHWHRDNVDHCVAGPDWNEQYPLVRMAVYLQDHAKHSGGLQVRAYSHLTHEDAGRPVLVDTRPGDIVVWSLRTLHAGETVRLRVLRGLPLHPRIQGWVPRWLRAPEEHERMAMFMTFGVAHSLTDRFVKYLGTRDYAVASWQASHLQETTRVQVSTAPMTLRPPSPDYDRED